MALTNVEKIKLVTLLGWPAKVLDINSTSYNSTIFSRINSIDSDIEPLVDEYVEKIEELDSRLSGAISRSGVKRIDDIEFFGSDGNGSSEFSVLRTERKRLLKELASILDIALGMGVSNSNMVNIVV